MLLLSLFPSLSMAILVASMSVLAPVTRMSMLVLMTRMGMLVPVSSVGMPILGGSVRVLNFVSGMSRLILVARMLGFPAIMLAFGALVASIVEFDSSPFIWHIHSGRCSWPSHKETTANRKRCFDCRDFLPL